MRNPWSAAFIAAVIALTADNAVAQEPNFGRALVLTERDLLIGQPVNWYGPGVVYHYRLDGAGRWREQARLLATDSSRKDDFGRVLAHEGNTLIVGAPRKRAGSGVAYVFTRASAGAGWRVVATIDPPAEGDDSEFASSMSLSGNDLLIGAPAVDSTGVLYHYRRARGAWTLHEVVRPSADHDAAAFGRSISVDGNWLLVGAPAADSGAGKVFVSRREANGNWGEPRALELPPSPRLRAFAGAAVLLDGRRAFIGAPGAARVFVLERTSDDSWSAAGELELSDDRRGSQFGHVIARVGDEVWVGAPGVNSGNGRVYRFGANASGGWREVGLLDADSADGTAWPFSFGYAIASAGNRAVVSMPQRDFGEGRALVLARQREAWQPLQSLEGRIYTIGENLTPGAQCENGKIGEFTCRSMQLVSHLPVSALGGARGVWVNDVWGWTDPVTNRDYALVARRDGASFVDLTDPAKPRLIGTLERTKGSPPSVWRDIKVIKNHAFIVADGARAHGMQVFDLTRLRTVADTPAVFQPETTYHRVHSAHNVVADTLSGFLYIVGANGGGESCGGGLHMVDARDPLRPAFAGCYNDRAGANNRGYTHDAQCVTYTGPDSRYRAREICVGSNEKEINIADVTDKGKPVTVGRNSYPNVSYAHQGWFDAEQRYFYMNDEGDELDGVVAGTRTIVWDLSRLDDPVVAYEYIGPVRASDHNLFVQGDRVYESNYGSGLRVLDISDRRKPREIAFFDSAPHNDDGPGHSAAQSGAWSNYPFFKSGVIVFTSVREGLFIVRVVDPKPIS